MHVSTARHGVLLGLTVFLSAAGALALEIIAARTLAPVLGMSLQTWTSVIAVVLAGLSIGHWASGRLLKDPRDAAHGDRIIAASLALAGVATVAIIAMRPHAAALIDSLGGIGVPSIIACTMLMVFLPSFLVGIVAPVATALAIEGRDQDRGRIIGRMFALGAAGSILGTMTAGFVLLSWVGVFRSLILIGAVYGILAALHWRAASRDR